MRFISEFRDATKAKSLLDQIKSVVTRPWSIMEICGGQTHSIIRYGIDQLLPQELHLVHGPGCPVCVTPVNVLDSAIRISKRRETILCTYGDMLRVPGSESDLAAAKASGADVRIVYSPLDALQVAMREPQKQVVFLAIGFETTAPANALAIKLAHERKLTNFSALVSQALVPPAIESILNDPNTKVNAFLAAGHVCSVTGYNAYSPLSSRFQVPIVVTGFEPLDLLEGIRRCVVQLERGQFEVENTYARVVTAPDGNRCALQVIEEVFERCDREWRGMGVLPQSGWQLRGAYQAYDAALRFPNVETCATSSEIESCCRSGEVLRGTLQPHHCEAFGTLCTPESPQGAPMVSNEGACAAYYQNRRISAANRLPTISN